MDCPFQHPAILGEPLCDPPLHPGLASIDRTEAFDDHAVRIKRGQDRVGIMGAPTGYVLFKQSHWTSDAASYCPPGENEAVKGSTTERGRPKLFESALLAQRQEAPRHVRPAEHVGALNLAVAV